EDIVKALTNFKDERLVEPLIDAFANSRTRLLTRSGIADSLAKIGNQRARHFLLETLKHGDDEARYTVADALEYNWFRDKRVVAALLAILNDPSQSLRLRGKAIITLGRRALTGYTSRSAIEPLLKALADD